MRTEPAFGSLSSDACCCVAVDDILLTQFPLLSLRTAEAQVPCLGLQGEAGNNQHLPLQALRPEDMP